MFYVEIELNGVTAAKRCPKMVNSAGFIDYAAIRAYFEGLGYVVGRIRVC